MIIDAHAHLDMIENLDEVINRAKENNVELILAQGVNIESLNKNLEIKNKYGDIVGLSAGLYPEETLKRSDYKILENFVKNNEDKIIAIGEIGMDFSKDSPKKDLQEFIFTKQLDLAQEMGLPVSIHTRKAEVEIINILKGYPKLKRILHCFSGNFKLIKEAEMMGCYFSIPTNIVRSEHFQKLVKEVNHKKILTETDSPYLSPFKDKTNESSYITESIKVIAKIWKVSIKEVEEQIEENSRKVLSF